MAPPFVACRICRSVEGKLKNYTDNTFLIKAYEEFSGCPFIELTYLTKFCPECACLIRKVYKFRRKCRKSYRFVVEHLNTGRKITKKFIEMTGTSLYHKPTDLSTWQGYRVPTIDYIHNPKGYKSKKKPVDEVVYHIKHVTVPKDPQAEIPTIVPEPIYDFNERYYDSSDLEEELYGKFTKKATTDRTLETNVDIAPEPSKVPVTSNLESPVILDSPVNVPKSPVDVIEAPMNELEAPSVLETTMCEPELLNDDSEIYVKMEDDMSDSDTLGPTDEKLDVKLEIGPNQEMDPQDLDPEQNTDLEQDIDPEQDTDPENLTLQEIKEGMLGATALEMEVESAEKGEKRKKTGKKKENESRVTKKSKQLQVQARRNRSNQELEEHFTITQFLTEEEQRNIPSNNGNIPMKDGNIPRNIGKMPGSIGNLLSQMQEFLKRKEGEGYLEGKYKCELCLKSFKEQKWMDAHVKKHEPSAGSHVCSICKIRSRTPKLYRTHRDCNHTTRHACRRCPFVTYSKAQALKHHGWHEGVEHTCQHCGVTFRKHTTYMGHLRRAHPSAHICGFCARSFVSAYGLNLHIKAVHKDINKLENDSTRCEECDVTFVSRQMYIRHVLITDRHKDMSKNILGCRKCGEQFETREEMEKHTHYKERKYVRKDAPRRSIKCDECSEVFSHPNGVYQHYLREHPDTPYRFAVRRHYLCEQCGKTFKSPGLLQQHALIHLGLRPPAAKKPPGRNSCRLCGKTYSKLSGLFRHKLTHLGVRRHKCHICEKAFTDTSNLKQHVQGVHLNIRRIRKR